MLINTGCYSFDWYKKFLIYVHLVMSLNDKDQSINDWVDRQCNFIDDEIKKYKGFEKISFFNSMIKLYNIQNDKNKTKQYQNI